MRGDFKLVITSGGKPELFDVAADPAERRNVAAEHPEVLRSLQADLKSWLATETNPNRPLRARPGADCKREEPR